MVQDRARQNLAAGGGTSSEGWRSQSGVGSEWEGEAHGRPHVGPWTRLDTGLVCYCIFYTISGRWSRSTSPVKSPVDGTCP